MSGSLNGRLAGLLALVLAAAAPAAACDVCAIYTATEMREARTGWVVGVAEQATRYKTGVPDATTGEPEDVGERLNSFITQVFAGYDFHPKFGVQVNLPIIARDYHRLRDRRLVDDRIKDGVMTKGNVSGPGDVALVAILRPWSRVTAETLLRFTLIGGLKLPSGDPGKLVEEQKLRRATEAEAAASRTAAAGRARIASAHHIPEGSPSGINGHDLALGSGSIDGIIGGAAFASWERLFTNWSVQHAIRSEGAYRYQYGDETNWFVGVGGYVLLAHDHTLTLEVVTSGKYQGTDTIEGTSTAADGEDSTTTFVFVGPALGVTWGTSFAFELAGDLPVVRPDEGLFPAYRVRGGLSWRF